MQNLSLYDEYEQYMLKYKKEYGDNVIVLYRCGQFYEMYSINDGLIDMKSIAELLNIQVSRRNKSIVDVNRSNTLMAGFPMFALRKFVNILVSNNFTVVIVDQISDPPKPKRAVTEIISPGTVLEGVDASESNNLMAIYVEEVANGVCIGCSIIDITTGISKTCEMGPRAGDNNYALDETYRIIITYNPKEVVLFGSLQTMKYEDFYTKLELTNRCVHNKINNFSTDILSVNYQNQLLEKLFPNHGLYTVAEYLDLERRPFALTSYTYLLNFAIKHNDMITNMMHRPQIMYENESLVIEYNALRQLNIIHSNDQKQNSLTYILNKCKTAIGKRKFKDMLLNPVTSSKELEKRYNKIDVLLSDKVYSNIHNELSRCYDLERLTRKMVMGRFHPADFCQVHETMEAVTKILDLNNDICTGHFEIGSLTDDVVSLKHEYTSVIDVQEAGKYHLDNIDGSFFKVGSYPEIDKLQSGLNNVFSEMNEVLNILNKENDGFFKLDSNDREGYYFLITSKRYKEMQKTQAHQVLTFGDDNIKLKDFTAKPVSSTSTVTKLSHKVLVKFTEKVNNIKNQLKTEILKEFKEFVNSFISKTNTWFEHVVRFIGDLDVYCTHADNAVSYKYYRPIIKQSENAYVNITDLRHPIIERVLQDTEYVTNDVALDDDKNGILLFGLNCSGKTSLSKAIALNVIMAQCGSFIPSNMTFSPFKSIFTRIPSGDDMFKSMSTFAVEMNELRNILKRADANSLIVGDEISHGTEVTSGVAIVSAAILELAHRKSKFVFATHLHNIINIDRVSQLSKVSMKHLSVYYDETVKTLVYDRKLKEGPGSSVYGLEVCKSLDLPKEFLELANTIRQEYTGVDNVLNFNKSRYNNAVYFDQCTLCSKKSDEIHHIKEQHMADGHGYVNNTYINAKHNLMNVCKECHDKIHNNEISIKGYFQTTEGVKLIWEPVAKAHDNEKEIINYILTSKNQGMSIAAITKNVNDAFPGNHITSYKVRKILKP